MSTEETKQYGAILVDTSIFDAHGLKLEKGLLGKLYQFKDSGIQYLLPDVIKSEVQSHLEKKVKINHKQLIKQKYETGILELRLTFEKSHNESYNPIEIIDKKINKSSKSYSNGISSQYDNSIINRDSIVLNIIYENIENSILLVKKTPYNNELS